MIAQGCTMRGYVICPLNFDVAVSVQFMKVSFYPKKKKLTRKTIAGTTLIFFPPST